MGMLLWAFVEGHCPADNRKLITAYSFQTIKAEWHIYAPVDKSTIRSNNDFNIFDNIVCKYFVLALNMFVSIPVNIGDVLGTLLLTWLYFYPIMDK